YRCFPHVINLVVKSFLRHLNIFNAEDAAREKTADWYITSSTPTTAVKASVAAVRASGERRVDFAATIKTGNAANDFVPFTADGVARQPLILREVILLTDVDTRWSATYLMIDRFLELFLAIERFLRAHNLQQHLFTHHQLQALENIRDILSFPHAIQEIASAKKTPTLALVVPLYELLRETLAGDLKAEYPKLSHAIDAAVAKLDEYLGMARQTEIYRLAVGMSPRLVHCIVADPIVAINPTLKFVQMAEFKWSQEDIDAGKASLRVSVSHRPILFISMLTPSDAQPQASGAPRSWGTIDI
ncbi:hypothetical protein C8F01DRAFT_1000427, partial [Mycena amicta]